MKNRSISLIRLIIRACPIQFKGENSACPMIMLQRERAVRPRPRSGNCARHRWDPGILTNERMTRDGNVRGWIRQLHPDFNVRLYAIVGVIPTNAVSNSHSYRTAEGNLGAHSSELG